MAGFAFERFVLDTADRRLKAAGETVELNGRYFDALALLVREQGKLVSKDRFLHEVWRGVPVTDEALTQCVKTLRRQLGDDAARPRFIETVPKHGYRFIAAVDVLEGGTVGAAQHAAPDPARWRRFVTTALAGVAGAGAAGAAGGLVYGFAGASSPTEVGAISVLLVLLCLTTLVAVIGGAGVGLGIAIAAFARPGSWWWCVVGGAAGGLVIGAFGKLLGLDLFALLVGRSPGDITGATEGMLLGGAVGLGVWLAARSRSIARAAALAAGCGAAAGIVISLLGGRLMLGSLELLAHGFPGSRLRLEQISRPFGESDFGPVTQLVSAGLEGALFSACIALAMLWATRAASR
jgi:DNA-binding winged helix-turn-helix (wHTH) protein